MPGIDGHSHSLCCQVASLLSCVVFLQEGNFLDGSTQQLQLKLATLNQGGSVWGFILIDFTWVGYGHIAGRWTVCSLPISPYVSRHHM